MNFRKIAFLLIASICCIGPASADQAGDMLDVSGIKGGVVVHIGCGDGQLTTELLASDSYLVQGLDTDADRIAKAKKNIDSHGMYGPVWAERFDGENLPEGDNIVNLIIVDDPRATAKLSAGEIVRALAPRGVAIIRHRGNEKLADALDCLPTSLVGFVKYTKPVPADIDEWTHYLYDASGNAVSKDKKVGHPRHLQWHAGPEHTRHHDALASMSAMTSSNGRLFYIYDEGEISVIHRPSDWKLVARDAFNGKLLWKRNIQDWMTQLFNFRAGPAQLPRRLVSIGDEVFVTLGFTAPIEKLDAATGRTLHTFAGSEKAEEIVYHDGKLLVITGDAEFLNEQADSCYGYWELFKKVDPTVDKKIKAYDAATGKILWTIEGENLKRIAPLSLSARGQRVFYLDNEQIHCLDLTSGREIWASPFKTEGLFIRSYTPTVALHDDVVLCLIWNRLCGYSIETGELLWENKGSIGFASPGDLFIRGDQVIAVPMMKAIWNESSRDKNGIVRSGIGIPKSEFLNDAKTAVQLDIHTGEITDLIPFVHNQHHHRCYRDKAVDRYLLIGHSGIQLVDPETKECSTNQWVRGLCQYGIMPANGLIYVPPDPCQCYSNVKINGFFALTEGSSIEEVDMTPVVERGPAFGKIKATDAATDSDWPTYRADIARSGSSTCKIGDDLTSKWAVEIGPSITAPVIAGDRVYVAERDTYTVYCLDRADGTLVWKFLGNGPIDTPPTIYRGQCLFGSGDGSVYCLDAATGQLAWRLKQSAVERRIGNDDRLESPLSINGAVLVVDDVAYFAAGHSSFLDGGIQVYGADVATGKMLYETTVMSGYWADADKTPVVDGRHRNVSGALIDILASDGEGISMRGVRMNKKLEKGGASTIMTSVGMLDSSWFHRLGWKYQKVSGKLIVHNDEAAFAIGNPYTRLKHERSRQYVKYNQDGHLHIKFTRYEEEFYPIGAKISSVPEKKVSETMGYKAWEITDDIQPRAMVLADQKLCVAGWLDAIAIEMKTGKALDPDNPDPRNSVLRIYATKDGSRQAEYKLEAEPVHDGMAAAANQLFVSLKNGKLVCLGEE